MTDAEYRRELGIQAIIALQALMGITETREKAEKGWDSLSEEEKKNTMDAHERFCWAMPGGKNCFVTVEVDSGEASARYVDQ